MHRNALKYVILTKIPVDQEHKGKLFYFPLFSKVQKSSFSFHFQQYENNFFPLILEKPNKMANRKKTILFAEDNVMEQHSKN